jgi:hypothetical protein
VKVVQQEAMEETEVVQVEMQGLVQILMVLMDNRIVEMVEVQVVEVEGIMEEQEERPLLVIVAVAAEEEVIPIVSAQIVQLLMVVVKLQVMPLTPIGLQGLE